MNVLRRGVEQKTKQNKTNFVQVLSTSSVEDGNEGEFETFDRTPDLATVSSFCSAPVIVARADIVVSSAVPHPREDGYVIPAAEIEQARKDEEIKNARAERLGYLGGIFSSK